MFWPLGTQGAIGDGARRALTRGDTHISSKMPPFREPNYLPDCRRGGHPGRASRLTATPFQWIKPAAIPPRRWLYCRAASGVAVRLGASLPHGDGTISESYRDCFPGNERSGRDAGFSNLATVGYRETADAARVRPSLAGCGAFYGSAAGAAAALLRLRLRRQFLLR